MRHLDEIKLFEFFSFKKQYLNTTVAKLTQTFGEDSLNRSHVHDMGRFFVLILIFVFFFNHAHGICLVQPKYQPIWSIQNYFVISRKTFREFNSSL